MSNQINPEQKLVMTIDDMMEILIVLHYLEITGEGMKREPRFYAVDTDFCVDKLRLVTERIKERNLVPN